jgi:bacillithiol system protein YtxJ
MNHFTPITASSNLEEIVNKSFEKPVLVFKHSTACPISGIVYNRIEESSEDLAEKFDCYLLFVIENRNASNAIAETVSIKHESPQVLLLKNGACVFNESHLMIKPTSLLEL